MRIPAPSVAMVAALIVLGDFAPAHAESFRVCALPVDRDAHVVRFCPTGRSPVPGASCQCDLQSVTLQGRIGSVETTAAGVVDAENAAVCLVGSDATKGSATFCPASSAHGVAGSACQCEGNASAGALYQVQMLPRYFLRGNSAAESDFLKRLRECCVVVK